MINEKIGNFETLRKFVDYEMCGKSPKTIEQIVRKLSFIEGRHAISQGLYKIDFYKNSKDFRVLGKQDLKISST